MGDKTSKLRLWSHVRQVAPLSGDKTKDAWFTLNMTPVLVIDKSGGGTDVTAVLAGSYLRPWLWSWTTIRVALLANGVVLSVIDLPASQVLRGKPDAVKTMLDNEFSLTSDQFDSAYFTEDETDPKVGADVDEDTTRDWKLYLFHASTYAGDIPIQSGLVTWFRIPYADLAGADELVVAPIFDGAPFSAALGPMKPGAGCMDLKAPAANCPMVRLKADLTPDTGANPALTVWGYEAPAGTDLKAEWLQPHLTLRIPESASWSDWPKDDFIDEKTYWVKPPVSGWLQQNDWHEQLEARLSGLFDLPLRMLEWADQSLLQPVGAPPGIDAKFGTALICAMRDLMRTTGDPASGQIVDRPDGRTLADDVARVLAPGTANATVRSQFVTAVRAYDQQFNAYSKWIACLTDALLTSSRFQTSEMPAGWENPPAAGGDFATWLKLVHRIRAWLFDPRNLAKFIVADWTNAVAATPTLAAILAANLGKLNDYLAQIDLLTVLRLGFLGVAWNGQKADWYSQNKVAGIMQTALVNVYRDRFALPGNTGSNYGKLLPQANGVTSAQQASIESYLRSFVTAWSTSPTGPAPTAGTTPDYSRGNHGINIQFSDALADAGAAANDTAFLATFRGIGVMLRPTGPNSATGQPYDWSVLNLGQYSIRDAVDPRKQIAPPLDLTRVVVAPTQIAFRNGLRQISCTYRGLPLSARSPSAALSQNRSMQGAGDNQAEYESFRAGPYELWNPFRGASPYRLPRLVFGQVYEAAAFAVGLAGELPSEICDSAKPWQVSATPSMWKPPMPLPLPAYLRTLPIGPVRAEGSAPRQSGQEISKMSGPRMPDNVYPITRGMPAIDPKDTVLLLCDPKLRASWTDFATDRTQFNVRPPSVDPQIFNAWPFSSNPPPADRAAILALIAQHTDITNDGGSQSAPDLTLDDPAVSQLSVKLSQIFPSPIEGHQAVFDVRRPSGTLINTYQSRSVPFFVSVGSLSDPPVVPKTMTDSYQVSVSVPPGTVYKLEIAPVATSNLGYFDPGAQKIATKTFYIEVATTLQIADLNAAATELNTSLTLGTGRNIEVSLDVSKLAVLKAQIHRVELMVQRWRWQGRPLPRIENNQTVFTFPYDAIPAPPALPDAALEPFDGTYFGERNTDDQLIIPGQVEGFATGSAALASLYRYDLTTSPQALYYRFAVRAFSRYEGYFTSGTAVESRIRGVTGGGSAQSTPEQWRRFLPLCSRAVQAPKPSVRLVIPLTQAGDGEVTPGLLVVLDDIWYDWAGLAEQFEVQIARAVQGSGTPLEAGPDPVVSLPDYDPNDAGNVTPIRIEQTLKPIGPIGFTTDTDPVAPLFGKTSFILPAPRAIDDDGNPQPIDLSWWFLQLQFKRSLIPAGTAIYDKGLDSAWTAPLQVQLLPAANLWRTDASAQDEPVDVNTLSLQFGQAGAAIRIIDDVGNAVAVKPTESSSGTCRFEVWALLTTALIDAFGNGTQEAFVDMIPFGSLASFALPAGKTAPTALRLVEVQAMNQISPPRAGWTTLAEDIFPSQRASGVDPTMARARIVRVSPPITQVQ